MMQFIYIIKEEDKMKKRIFALLLALIFVFAFSACNSAPDAPAPAPEPEQAAPEPAPAPEPDQSPADDAVKPYKVGLSNTFMYPWRAQMIDDMERVFENYKGRGWVEGDLIIQHAGVDTNAQIAQIRNMVNDGVDILLINPISADGLNEVVEEAVAKGVVVVAFDQAISAQGVYNVTIDHYVWGSRFAEWLVQAIDEQGDIVYIEGLPGHPANDDRVRGWVDTIAKYPDINIVGSSATDWDNPSAQKAASQLIATNPNINGILAMDGMGVGLFNALVSAKKVDQIKCTGETQVAVLQSWSDLLEEYPDFESFGVVNPPGIGATALGFAIRIAQGKEFTGEFVNGNTYYYDVEIQVDKSNFQEFYDKYVVSEGRPDAYWPDEWLSDDELDALFR